VLRQSWVISISALAAPFAGAHPVGNDPLDWAWSAGLAALAAFLGVRSKRLPLLVAAGVAVLAARTAPALVVAALAVAAGALSTKHLRRRAVFARGCAGGATVVSLLATSEHASSSVLGTAVPAVVLLLWSSGYRGARKAERRRLRWGAIGVLGFCTVATGLAAAAVADKADVVDVGTLELRAGLASARVGDVAGAGAHFGRVEAALDDASTQIGRWGLLARVVPVSAQHVDALTSVLHRVERATRSARQVAELTDDGLSVTAGSIDVGAISRLHGPLERLQGSFGSVLDEIQHQLQGPLISPLADRLQHIADQAARAHADAAIGAEAARTMPAVLGGGEARRYLVVFTSPAEARGRLGFPSSFAEITLDHGRYRLGEHGSTSKAFGNATFVQGRFDVGDPALRPYLPYGVTRSLLSATVAPDFPTVARVLAEMWAQTGRPPVDGVLRLDPAALAPLLTFTGPVTVEGRAAPLTAENLEQYLLVGQYLEFAGSPTQASRREVLDDVAELTFERLETADLPTPRRLFDLFGPIAESGHLDVALFDPAAERLVGSAGIAGRFDPPTSDGLMVTTVNGLGNKIDSFVQTAVDYRGAIRGRSATTTAKVTINNGAPAGGLPDYVIGSFAQPPPPKGTNRSTVLIYTALPARRIDAGPGRVLESTLADGWWVHEVEVEIPPGGSATITLDLGGDLPSGPYRLLLEPGGGTHPEEVSVDVDVDSRRLHHTGRADRPLVLG
jgi:hypothetical protein